MDNINRSTLNNALQRITQLERMAVNSTNADPDAEIFSSLSTGSASSVNNFPSQRNQSSHTQPNVRCYPSTQTVTTANKNRAEELYSRFPSLRRPGGHPLSTQSGRVQTGKKKKQSRSSSRKTTSTKPVLMDLILIPNPEETIVATHSTRVLLDSKSFVVHSFPFQREYDSRTLTSKIDEAFPNHFLLCFEYMKASYGKLIKPNLPSGVEITGNLLLKLSGQGSVYIRSLESLDDDSASESVHSPVTDHNDLPEYFPPFHDELSCETGRGQQQTAVTNEVVSNQNYSIDNQKYQ